MIVDEPLHAAFEAGQMVDDVLFQSFDREQRDEPHEGANFEIVELSTRTMKHVVVEPVLLIPELNAFATAIAHGVSDVHKVLKEFAGDALIGWILPSEFESDGQHIEAIHAHPTGSVRLFKMPAGRQGSGAVKDADVVEPEEAALEYVHALGVFSIHPPGEIQKKFVKRAFQEIAVGNTSNALFDFVYTPHRPCMNGWIHVAEGPFVG